MKYQQDQLILRALMIVLKKRKWLFRKSFLVLLLIISKICPWKINIQHLVLCKPGAQYFQRHFQHEFSCGNICKDSFGSVRSRSQMFFKICHLKNFANFARKYVSQPLYNQVADPRLRLQLDYKEIPTQEFSCDTCEIMKNIFF